MERRSGVDHWRDSLSQSGWTRIKIRDGFVYNQMDNSVKNLVGQGSQTCVKLMRVLVFEYRHLPFRIAHP